MEIPKTLSFHRNKKILERRPSLVNHLESKPSLYERLKIFEYARIRRGLSEGGTKVWGLVNTFAFLGGVREDVEFARIIAEKEKERKMREGYGDVEDPCTPPVYTLPRSPATGSLHDVPLTPVVSPPTDEVFGDVLTPAARHVTMRTDLVVAYSPEEIVEVEGR